MRVYVAGKLKAVSEKEIRFATKWFINELLGTKLGKNVTIKIRFAPNLGCWGECRILASNTTFPRKFQINLDNTMSRYMALRTLAHELVHIKQFAKCELKENEKEEVSRWKKRYFTETNKNYDNMPWEKEAWRIEQKLYKKYRQYLKENPKIQENF